MNLASPTLRRILPTLALAALCAPAWAVGPVWLLSLVPDAFKMERQLGLGDLAQGTLEVRLAKALYDADGDAVVPVAGYAVIKLQALSGQSSGHARFNLQDEAGRTRMSIAYCATRGMAIDPEGPGQLRAVVYSLGEYRSPLDILAVPGIAGVYVLTDQRMTPELAERIRQKFERPAKTEPAPEAPAQEPKAPEEAVVTPA